MYRYWVPFLIFNWINISLLAQDTLHFNIDVNYNNRPLVLDSIGYWYQDHPIIFSSLKFYISNIVLQSQQEKVSIPHEAYLVDLSKPQSLSRTIILENPINYQQITFTIGTDSLVNVSGILEGDLSPIHGMYWTWQSGYINFKLEGFSPYCHTRKNQFQYHLGGYLYPLSTAQTINYSLGLNQKKIILQINLEQFMESIDLERLPTLMSPSSKAVKLSQQLKKAIQLNAP